MAAPQTAFEQSGGQDWTSLPAGDQFLQALAADSPKVAVDHLGNSGEGRRIDLVRVGHPTPRPLGTRKTMMMVGIQHGNEPAGREAVLQFVRDLAYSTDPAHVAFLTDHDLVAIPTSSPDAVAANTRLTRGINMNRSHINLEPVEAQYIHQVIRDARPHLVLDCHEFAGNRERVEMLNPEVQNAAPAILSRAADLFDHVGAAVAAEGIPHAAYASGPKGSPAWLIESGPLQHALSLLVETPFGAPAIAPATRVQWHHIAYHAALAWYATHSAAIAAEIATARDAAIRDGLDQAPFPIHQGDTLDPAPIAYRLTADQATCAEPHLRSFGLNWAAAPGRAVIVPMDQEKRPLLPHLFDPSSPEKVADATRVYPATGQPEGPLSIALHGGIHPVDEVRARFDGQLQAVTQILRRDNGSTRVLWP